MNRRQRLRYAETRAEVLAWQELGLESELAREELGAVLEFELGLKLELGSAPTTSRIAQPHQPKLPGISSRFLLRMHVPVVASPEPPPLAASMATGGWRLAFRKLCCSEAGYRRMFPAL